MTLALNKPFEPFDRGKVGKWMRQEDAKTFIEYLRNQIHLELSQIRGARELLEIGRIQGRLEVLDKILKMREE